MWGAYLSRRNKYNTRGPPAVLFMQNEYAFLSLPFKVRLCASRLRVKICQLEDEREVERQIREDWNQSIKASRIIHSLHRRLYGNIPISLQSFFTFDANVAPYMITLNNRRRVRRIYWDGFCLDVEHICTCLKSSIHKVPSRFMCNVAVWISIHINPAHAQDPPQGFCRHFFRPSGWLKIGYLINDM